LRRSRTTLPKLRAAVVGNVLLGVAALLGVVGVLPAGAATYTGVLPTPGVVWISDDSKPTPGPEVEMRNAKKSFVPDLVIITVGSSVRFPNDDPFFHSIYSESGPDDFDIGFYDNGPGKSVEFPKPGIVSVRCHIHGPMHATIVVVDGPWAQTHESNASYSLVNVRPGSHVLHRWSPESGEQTMTVKV
jgi:plastocyanin